MCRQRTELWVRVGYMQLCVERETGIVGEGWLHEAVCRQRPEMWPKIDYMKLCVDRDLNWGQELVT